MERERTRITRTGQRKKRRWIRKERRDKRCVIFFFQAEDGIRDIGVTGVQTCALPICHEARTGEQAREIAETLGKTVLRFEVNAGPRGRLFGSVTPTNIADELWRTRKVRVDRRKIHLDDPIKRVGRYEVPIDVYEDVRVEVKTLVVPVGGELPSEDELAAWEAEEAAERTDSEAAGEVAPADAEAGPVD